MKAYGLRDKLKYNFIDNHPRKGYVNWWESELGDVNSKKSERQKSKKLIQKELEQN